MNLSKRTFNKWPYTWLSLVLLEAWPIFVLLFALIIEFRHIASSAWLQVFLYNSDSLTLPILRQVLSHHDPFLWVSSSQFLLFPEGLFYAISSLLTASVRASLIFNGALNVVVLYVIIRWMSQGLLKVNRLFKQLFALGCCLLLIFYMILERQANVNSNSVATLFLFNTYYYGVIICGAFLLAIILKQLKDFSLGSTVAKRQLVWAAVAFIVAALAVFSDPIFAIQFVVPLGIVLGVLFLCDSLKFKATLLAGLPIAIGSLVGYVARSPFKSFLGQSLGNHIDTQRIPTTLTLFHQAISNDLHSKSGTLELTFVAAIIVFCWIYSGWWIYQKTRHRKHSLLEGRYAMLALLGAIEPLVIIVFSIVSGSMTTRYLLPLVIFPMLGLLPLLTFASKTSERFIRLTTIGAVVGSLLVIGAGAFSIGKAHYLLSDTSFPGTKCLSTALHNRPAYGLGTYWTVRALDVYGQPNEVVLQVNERLVPYAWQSNLGAYYKKAFSFLLVDRHAYARPEYIPPLDPFIPPNPSEIHTCTDFYVYVYLPTSEGYKQLNSTIAVSYGKFVSLRSAGNIAQSF